MRLTDEQVAAIPQLSPRALQILGLILWRDEPDCEIEIARSDFYVRLHYHADNGNMMQIQQEVGAAVRELQRGGWPRLNIRVGDNDRGETEQLFTISY
ncbi:hypothetical protein [Lacticaseibacillus zhaodongensis]|uniref:hypothetical protein n=1 Tax=Lacticaseibacillus zhaodongensis TaxID=2668065 RepID=UPI0012D366EB|nr:hypothetical protein [Lacticaseibacillus zhaodongensis]